jgi:GPH family glycoside/pentoside/hexuronide:cation symporter
LGLKESDVVLKILFPFFVVIIVSIPIWVLLSNRYGKKRPAFFGILMLGLITMIAYPLYPYGNSYYPLITAIVGGICAGSIFLLDSLVADIVDYDELMTGESKEGLYFGFWKMGTKFAQAIGLAVSGFILDIIGLVQGSTEQTAEVGWRLAVVFGPVVGFFFIIGAIVFLWMPLNSENHKRIQLLLEKKNQRKLRKEQSS